MSRVLDLWTGLTAVVFPFAGTAAPTGWLLCHGQAISRADYPTLFDRIGTTYGTGDGTTTFNVPDFRGRAPVGKDNMGGTAANRLTTAAGGVDAATLGAAGGASTHTLTTAQMPLHGHPFRLSPVDAGTARSDDVGGIVTREVSQTNKAAFTGTPSDAAGEQIGGAGGGGAHPIVQPSLVVNYIIKT